MKNFTFTHELDNGAKLEVSELSTYIFFCRESGSQTIDGTHFWNFDSEEAKDSFMRRFVRADFRLDGYSVTGYGIITSPTCSFEYSKPSTPAPREALKAAMLAHWSEPEVKLPESIEAQVKEFGCHEQKVRNLMRAWMKEMGK